jgi:hypothetical protein
MVLVLFYRVDETMINAPKHPLASLWPSEVVTLGLLFALKGVSNRAFYRWVHRDRLDHRQPARVSGPGRVKTCGYKSFAWARRGPRPTIARNYPK